MNAIQRFRLSEIKALPRYLFRNGPLPPKAIAPGVIRLPNPFLPHKNSRTGRWSPPKYSLRRQAELIKEAKATNTLHLLPPGLKFDSRTVKSRSSDEVWNLPVDWEGTFSPKKPAGANIGARLYAGKKRMFKGHKWERLQRRQTAYRKMLLKSMNQRIFNYKHASQFNVLFSDYSLTLFSITNGANLILQLSQRSQAIQKYRSDTRRLRLQTKLSHKVAPNIVLTGLHCDWRWWHC